MSPPRASENRSVPFSLTGVLRASPEDFRVDEELGFAPDGGTAHWLLRVEKRDANTLFVARELARAAHLRRDDVGFAGLKDRRAVATQWLSVPTSRAAPAWEGFEGPGFRVLEAHPHSRKLRRGALAGNRFEIVIRDVAGDASSLTARVADAARGVPNYFGPQRFGRDGANLGRVRDWLAGGELPRSRDERSFVLSAARSLAFNTVLSVRVAEGSWQRLLPGEVVNLDGSGSVFVAEVVDAELAARCEARDVHPTGPLPGRGGREPVGQAAEVERAALARHPGLVEALVAAGLEADRRPLRVVPHELAAALAGDVLTLSFRLRRGSFATAVVRELVRCESVETADES